MDYNMDPVGVFLSYAAVAAVVVLLRVAWDRWRK